MEIIATIVIQNGGDNFAACGVVVDEVFSLSLSLFSSFFSEEERLAGNNPVENYRE